MAKKNRGKFDDIKSFEDFQNEKVRVYYEIQYIQKKLQLKYYGFSSYLTNPRRFMPLIIARLITPLFEILQDNFSGLFKRNKGEF